MNSYYYSRTQKKKKTYRKIGGFLLLSMGVSLLLYFFFPLLSYHVFLSSVLATSDIEVPIPKYQVASKTNRDNLFVSGIVSLTSDFTDARNWYPNVTQDNNQLEYTLSIPKLGIKKASVSAKDYDLSKHVVHYYGTSAPGTAGTAVIFGHSTLPQLFDAKNYKTIFATLHTLKVDDTILAIVQGITYTYKIHSISITTPEDTKMFSQTFDTSYLTLVTCTPPGTVWKRLVVRARLDSLEK